MSVTIDILRLISPAIDSVLELRRAGNPPPTSDASFDGSNAGNEHLRRSGDGLGPETGLRLVFLSNLVVIHRSEIFYATNTHTHNRQTERQRHPATACLTTLVEPQLWAGRVPPTLMVVLRAPLLFQMLFQDAFSSHQLFAMVFQHREVR